MWRKRDGQGGSLEPGGLERGVPHRSTGSGIAILRVHLGVAQCSSASSEPALPTVGHGRNNPRQE